MFRWVGPTHYYWVRSCVFIYQWVDSIGRTITIWASGSTRPISPMGQARADPTQPNPLTPLHVSHITFIVIKYIEYALEKTCLYKILDAKNINQICFIK